MDPSLTCSCGARKDRAVIEGQKQNQEMTVKQRL